MTRLHLVRHGPTHARTMIGWTDRPADLSDTARIARLSAHLPAEALIVSSDLCRAVATADALAAPGRRRLPHDPDLRELHFGDWEDRAFADIEAAEPEALAAFWQSPGPARATGGECWDDMARRVGAAADRVLAAAEGAEVIVVAHFGAILSQLIRARGGPVSAILGQTVAPLSVTTLHPRTPRWREIRANHCP